MALTPAQEWAHWYMLHGHLYGLWFAGALFCVFVFMLGFERFLLRWGQLQEYFIRRSNRIRKEERHFKKKYH